VNGPSPPSDSASTYGVPPERVLPDSASTYSAGSAPAARAAQPARILVVDDELGVREGCRKILAAEGYEAVTAGDGKAGLEQFLERGPFAALLVDLQCPGCRVWS
jgi:PleD family two-component response regulator